ncbi:S8/S53 family peptidase [Solirubrobacter sp. CPCC 204708]|uniref:S8/S53 family peptidase n=1 Tax=Solirubrobacter deserti TaxID=2282478 RepID=A0ABT4RDM8_9ACTN|nr:S8/S53 family peptidase [Solirubrobacter deserti]MBE2317788.1 S8/S53 family peptidase [Solirubrobacter deserti]MDA0136435.1 S8/S53 family peptidase [Solirubrobacter deserti]
MKRLAFLVCALLLGPISVATAEPVDVTAQAKAANAEFLLRATPPAAPAAICLVDTGVNANPDTGGVVAKFSLPGLDGTDQSPTLHGTQMAMLASAAPNGYGMVGLWPSARIVSVQANFPGQDAFVVTAYVRGIDVCTRAAETHGVRVIVVPIASESPLTEGEQQQLHEVVAAARAQGLSVVVAAGNLDGRPVGTPANAPGAFSVGASDAASGSLCASSATGALLLAPGCSIDGADPSTGQPITSQSGTSAAAVIVGTALAALRTWRPDLAPAIAEQLLNETGTATLAGRRLNLAAAFTAAGLSTVVQPPATPATVPPPVQPTPKPRLVKPRVTVKFRARVLTVRVRNRPAGTTVQVRVYVRNGKRLRRVATRSRQAATMRIRVRRWSRVVVKYTDPSAASTASPTTTVSHKR